ncbi:MAG: GNAT family N-acetyltransferase [Oscillibacter sp.]|nr:GNAT family N-acetyltransferase [Oscillibacter sp.]
MAFSSDLLFKIKSGEFQFKRLTLETKIKSFDCNNPDLADFLMNDSKIYLKYLRYTTFIIENQSTTIAYYSLANDVLRLDPKVDTDLDDKIKISIADKDYPFQEYMFSQNSFPAVKIGRLAVHEDFRNKGYGTDIIKLLAGSFKSNNKTGCQFITVDAINSHETLRFYEKNDFEYVTLYDVNQESRQMYKILI